MELAIIIPIIPIIICIIGAIFIFSRFIDDDKWKQKKQKKKAQKKRWIIIMGLISWGPDKGQIKIIAGQLNELRDHIWLREIEDAFGIIKIRYPSITTFKSWNLVDLKSLHINSMPFPSKIIRFHDDKELWRELYKKLPLSAGERKENEWKQHIKGVE